MIRLLIRPTAVSIALALVSAAVGAGRATFTPSPGVERWQVKTGIDNDTGDVTREKTTTVEHLSSVHRPSITSGLPSIRH